MKYLDFFELNKKDIVKHLEFLMIKYRVEPVGYGYIDCIVMKDKLEEFIKEISNIGVLITTVSWWCYVDPKESIHSGCPHGMGGPKSIYYEGWFSELQNPSYDVDEKIIDNILESFDKHWIYTVNMKTLDGIRKMLEKPFRYTSKDFIIGNKCVTPALWMLVPDDWKR